MASLYTAALSLLSIIQFLLKFQIRKISNILLKRLLVFVCVCRGGCIICKRGNFYRLISFYEFAKAWSRYLRQPIYDIRRNTVRGSKIFCDSRSFQCDNRWKSVRVKCVVVVVSTCDLQLSLSLVHFFFFTYRIFFSVFLYVVLNYLNECVVIIRKKVIQTGGLVRRSNEHEFVFR
jgi:hypothetical protein